MAAAFRSTEEAKVLLWLMVVFSAIFVTMLVLEVCVCEEHLQLIYFWLQLVTGSSWPGWEGLNSRHPLGFALGITFHIMLNIGPLLGIIWVGLKIIRERGNFMELAQALKLRDIDIKLRVKTEVLKSFAQNINPAQQDAFKKNLDIIFNEATDRWKEDLTVLIGEERAGLAADILKRDLDR